MYASYGHATSLFGVQQSLGVTRPVVSSVAMSRLVNVFPQ